MADFAPGLPKKDVRGDLKKIKPGEFVDFVVQKHDAERAGTHYDVRFGTPESGLYSWATKKDLPKPKERIALFRQPLHSHDYKDFEGEIPAGYGKGKVSKFEEGKILIQKITKDAIHFVKAHKKFPERFALVAPKEKGDNRWLLVNTTPTEPIPYNKIHYTTVHPDKAEKIVGGLQPGSSVQAKIDGAASLTKLMNDKFETVSYRASKQTGGPIIHTERLMQGKSTTVSIPKKYVGSVLRGELYGTRDGKTIPPQELGGLLNSSVYKSVMDQKERNVELKNMIFDIQQIGKSPVSKDLPYEKRMKILKDVVKHLPADKFHVPEEAKTPEAAKKLLKAVKGGKHSTSKEGIVIHPPTGKPLKSKLTEEHDVYIRGFFKGEGKLKGKAVGGFTYSFKPNGPIVGKVGTGFSDDLRKDMYKNPDDYVGRVAKVTAQEKFQSGALRAPRLSALHEDLPLAKTSSNLVLSALVAKRYSERR
jgi:hypothetical protein